MLDVSFAAADLTDSISLRQSHVSLAQKADDLFRRIAFPGHVLVSK
jgi:hypothetical protein